MIHTCMSSFYRCLRISDVSDASVTAPSQAQIFNNIYERSSTYRAFAEYAIVIGSTFRCRRMPVLSMWVCVSVYVVSEPTSRHCKLHPTLVWVSGAHHVAAQSATNSFHVFVFSTFIFQFSLVCCQHIPSTTA